MLPSISLIPVYNYGPTIIDKLNKHKVFLGHFFSSAFNKEQFKIYLK